MSHLKPVGSNLVWTLMFFKISFIFQRRKSVKQVWNDMRVSE